MEVVVGEGGVPLATKADTAPCAPGTSTSKALTASTPTPLSSTSVPCTRGAYVTNPYDSGVIVQVGTSGVGASSGIQLVPGDRVFVPCSNLNQLYGYSTGTPTLHLQPW